MVIERKLFEQDDAVYAREGRRMWGGEVEKNLPENFLVAMPIGLMRNELKGGTDKGAMMNFESISFWIRRSTANWGRSGFGWADWRRQG